MIEVRIHPAAEAEYKQALAWYLVRSTRAAERFEAAVDEGIGAIQDHQTLFPLCDGIHRYVFLIKFTYALIYRFDG